MRVDILHVTTSKQNRLEEATEQPIYKLRWTGNRRTEDLSLVFERCVDICVATSIELPHFKRNLTAFGVTFGRLISLVQLADFLVNRRRGIGARRHFSIYHYPVYRFISCGEHMPGSR
ncbi:unknown [Haloarcula marismortui ATCC 43049]|uniref:Uncharacterized protein n=1 Tax=Haloarcula marismortui (strain ATCC 43049 / DSM 3752 / JCM 8966 / VKM B-1809) TaxID=272569 RepID=Q5UWM5_HALMA|nr:unknown [Haloarcula marismortui ATCC 43049]